MFFWSCCFFVPTSRSFLVFRSRSFALTREYVMYAHGTPFKIPKNDEISPIFSCTQSVFFNHNSYSFVSLVIKIQMCKVKTIFVDFNMVWNFSFPFSPEMSNRMHALMPIIFRIVCVKRKNKCMCTKFGFALLAKRFGMYINHMRKLNG